MAAQSAWEADEGEGLVAWLWDVKIGSQEFEVRYSEQERGTSWTASARSQNETRRLEATKACTMQASTGRWNSHL